MSEYEFDYVGSLIVVFVGSFLIGCHMTDFEQFTPREQAEVKAERAVRDAWLAVTEACTLHKDPIARPVIERQFDDLMSMRTKLDLLCSAIDVSRERSAA